jgi:hypothetical protein
LFPNDTPPAGRRMSAMLTEKHIHNLANLTFDLSIEGTLVKITKDHWAHCPMWTIEISIPKETGTALYDEVIYLCKYEDGTATIFNEDRDISTFTILPY